MRLRLEGSDAAPRGPLDPVVRGERGARRLLANDLRELEPQARVGHQPLPGGRDLLPVGVLCREVAVQDGDLALDLRVRDVLRTRLVDDVDDDVDRHEPRHPSRACAPRGGGHLQLELALPERREALEQAHVRRHRPARPPRARRLRLLGHGTPCGSLGFRGRRRQGPIGPAQPVSGPDSGVSGGVTVQERPAASALGAVADCSADWPTSPAFSDSSAAASWHQHCRASSRPYSTQGTWKECRMKILRTMALVFGLSVAAEMATAVTIDFESMATGTYSALAFADGAITYTGGDMAIRCGQRVSRTSRERPCAAQLLHQRRRRAFSRGFHAREHHVLPDRCW